jgi:phospholipid/cholesterol/gamma-HCH transport system substrate-binding protein
MAIKSFRDRRPIVVGLVSLLVIVLATTATFLTGTMGLLNDRYTMTGIFSDTGDLRSGEDVVVAGVRVGQITDVAPNFDIGEVKVTWKVDRGVDLGPATRAEIRMANILGGRFLRLSGPVTKPYMADVPERKRQIPLDRTKIPITVNDVLKSGTETVQKLDTKTFSKVLDQLSGLDATSQKKIASAFSKLTSLADGINSSNSKIEQLLDNSDRVIGIVTAKDAQLSRLVTNAETLIATLRKRRSQLALLLGSGSKAVQNITTLINDQQGNLVKIIDDLNGTMKTLGPEVGQLNSALAWAGPTLNGFASIADEGNYVDVIFTQLAGLSPTDLAKLAGAMKKAAPKK